MVQAEFGDCLIVECGAEGAASFVLVDGGPGTTYPDHLKARLEAITQAGGKVDLAMLSHVDNDHITGMLDLFSELREQRAAAQPETVAVEKLWLNSFAQTIAAGTDIQPRLRSLLSAGGSEAMPASSMAIEGIGEGNSLRLAAMDLQVPTNPGFANGIVCVDDAPPPVQFGDLVLRVVGPTRANLDALKEEWLAWLDQHAPALGTGVPAVAAMADKSVPNLSSIMVVAEAHGTRILFTGDGRGDHVIQGLGQSGLLDAAGTCQVEVLKVPHHGSDRNVTRSFFEAVIADTYVISANGKYGNPDLPTLVWIVETAKERGQHVRLVLTNETPSSTTLRNTYDPTEWDYDLEVMIGGDVLTLDLAHGSP